MRAFGAQVSRLGESRKLLVQANLEATEYSATDEGPHQRAYQLLTQPLGFPDTVIAKDIMQVDRCGYFTKTQVGC